MASVIRCLRGFATLAGLVALVVYTWGLLHLMRLGPGGGGRRREPAPLPPCRGNEQAVHVIDYSVSFFPLSFDCEMTGGGSYPAEVIPGYVNPVAVGSALAAVGCAVASAYVAELRLRAGARKGEAA